MSKNRNDADSFPDGLFGIVWFLFAKCFALFGYVLSLIFYPVKAPLSEAWHLKRLSSYWPTDDRIISCIKWASCLAFFKMLAHALVLIFTPPSQGGSIGGGLLLLMGCAVAGLMFNLISWLQTYGNDADLQKQNAGDRAEVYVRKCINRYHKKHPDSRIMHNALFIFKSGTDDEFTREIDHLLITQRNIYLIETKYKSGAIAAIADEPRWIVTTERGESTMANALTQARTACRILQKQFQLPVEIRPIVAIHGKNVSIVKGTEHVVAATGLHDMINRLESIDTPLIDPSAVARMLMMRLTIDPAAMERHIARAKVASAKQQMREPEVIQ